MVYAIVVRCVLTWFGHGCVVACYGFSMFVMGRHAFDLVFVCAIYYRHLLSVDAVGAMVVYSVLQCV